MASCVFLHVKLKCFADSGNTFPNSILRQIKNYAIIADNKCVDIIALAFMLRHQGFVVIIFKASCRLSGYNNHLFLISWPAGREGTLLVVKVYLWYWEICMLKKISLTDWFLFCQESFLGCCYTLFLSLLLHLSNHAIRWCCHLIFIPTLYLSVVIIVISYS